jgi:hypothetical protein
MASGYQWWSWTEASAPGRYARILSRGGCQAEPRHTELAVNLTGAMATFLVATLGGRRIGIRTRSLLPGAVSRLDVTQRSFGAVCDEWRVR